MACDYNGNEETHVADNSTTASQPSSVHEDDLDFECGSATHASGLFRRAFNMVKEADSGLEFRAYGTGVDQLRNALDDAMVQWALLRLELGSGSFQRQKILFLHLNGEDCPTVRRGRLNARTAEVQDRLRGGEIFHASLALTRAEDVTLEEIMSRVGKCFVSDDLGNHSARWQNRHSISSPVEVRKRSKTDGESPDALLRNRRCPGHKSNVEFETGRDALRSLAGEGPNWILLLPDVENLTHVDCGTGSVDEMRECLEKHEDEVLFGILRMSFGVGRLRRTKFVFVKFVGCKARAKSRGEACAMRPRMEQALAEFTNISVSMEFNGTEDLTLEEILAKLQRVVIHDDDLKGDEAALQVYCIDAFRKALAEERSLPARRHSAPMEFMNYDKKADTPTEETVKLSHVDGAPLHWAVFGPSDAWLNSPGNSKGRQAQFPPRKST